jgi:outer membrane receptor protein involved in Fe transport
VLVIGNRDLRPEATSGVEFGWKAQFDRLFLSADVFYSELKDFTSELLPGVNPAYGAWTAPSQVPDAARGPLEAAVAQAVGAGLTRIEGGPTAYVVSSGNAGTAKEYGTELAAGWQLRDGLRVDANYAYYGFSVDQAAFVPGDTVRANTPPNTANASIAWNGRSGARVRVGYRFEDAFRYRVGLWNGPLPAAHAFDVNLAYPLTRTLDLSFIGTNVLDERRVHALGGTAVGSRVLASMTWTP